jgi:hypothetical protein
LILEEIKKCEYCGKDAIGLQSLEGGFAYVCHDHADGLLLALKPGEKNLMVFVILNDMVQLIPDHFPIS